MNDTPKFTTRTISIPEALRRLGKGTVAQVQKESGRTQRTTVSQLQTLHNTSKAHICGWLLTSRQVYAAVWCDGDGDDVREPRVLKHADHFIPRPDAAAAWLRNPI